MAAEGSTGPIRTMAAGLTSIDDFAFTGEGDQLLAALNVSSELVLITPGSRTRVVLDADD